jgi:hypothetical protein
MPLWARSAVVWPPVDPALADDAELCRSAWLAQPASAMHSADALHAMM